MAVVVLTLAGPALVGAPASDAATTDDPAAAIQRQLVKGHGVRTTRYTTFRYTTFNSGSGWERFKPTKGVVGFGDGKVVATDLWDFQVRKAGVRDIC
ncbi:hypothetical protein [Nonomuraea sp. NPDC049750]|uniref:hypothetical protein n=1 Tax=Nonomuraea sp. NPDC049750 TaxID=3154738 RepID=UPI0033CD4C90